METSLKRFDFGSGMFQTGVDFSFGHTNSKIHHIGKMLSVEGQLRDWGFLEATLDLFNEQNLLARHNSSKIT